MTDTYGGPVAICVAVLFGLLLWGGIVGLLYLLAVYL